MRVSLLSGLEGGNPPPPLGLDGGTPLGTGQAYSHQDWRGSPRPSAVDGGTHPPLPPRDRAAERVLATRRAVCLLRSRRRTFLF